MAEDIQQQFGKHLRSLRLAKGLSQEKLGLLADLDRTYISGVERGQRNISLINLGRIAHALNLPLDKLLQFDGQPDA
ncbi:MAG: helix-turn-helix transcriptional regulator [Methylophaga sp.]|nr:helix-turn-helix transcriptional regulator [Methylophaga sp.]